MFFAFYYNNLFPEQVFHIARSIEIIIAPMVILQSVVAFVFMERHWNSVTRHLSAAVVADIAAIADLYKIHPQESDHASLRRLAQARLGLTVDFLPVSEMPPPLASSPCAISHSRLRPLACSISTLASSRGRPLSAICVS